MHRPILYRPEALLAGTFASLIVLGTVLLRLPVAHGDRTVGLLDAFFTATSAVCVTGLVTVDTATAYSRFGQTVVLLLIQLGGLGIMTFGAVAAEVLRLPLSFTSQAAWQAALFDNQARGDLRRALRRLVLLTLVLEAIGAALLLAGLRAGPAPRGGLFEAVFLAVSAFCNAGFSVYSDSVMSLRDSGLILGTLAGLIIAGGLGYAVLLEVGGRTWRRIRRERGGTVLWSLHARVVLRVSGLLIAGGAVLLLLTGVGREEAAWSSKLAAAAFQSVSSRTAGFNTVDIGALPVAPLLVLILLMFVGGSPGSCAGGVKTTTATVWAARVRARLAGREAVTLWGRRIPQDVVRRAALILSVATLWNLGGIMILALSEGERPDVRFEHLVFEQISAFATVGLSPGITPGLSVLGKLWIIVTMFVGRLGPLTVALAVLARPRSLYNYPAERVMLG